VLAVTEAANGRESLTVESVPVLTALLMLVVAAVEPQLGGAVPGTPIVAVRIVRHDVFDVDEPPTSSWPYRAANALHVLTRESFIRSQLLFREGDPLDPALLIESERSLRALGFLNPVRISARLVDGGAEVRVETHDQFSTEVALNFGLAGSRSRVGVSLSEQNFLGRGLGVSIDARRDQERDSLTFSYDDPAFLGSRWKLSAGYRDASDGTMNALRFEYPFYSLATQRAGGGAWRHETLREYLWSGGEKTVSGEVSRAVVRLWGGMRLPWNGGVTDRLTLGIFHDRAFYDDWAWRDGAPYPDPEDRELSGVEVGWEHQADRWAVVQGFRVWVRQEDLPLGPNWRASLGVSAPVFGGDRTRLPFAGSVTVGTLRGAWYSWLNVGASGRLEDGSAANGVLHMDGGTARTGRSGLRMRAALDLGNDLDLDRQLTLGADVGLRGWEPDWFDGTSRAVASVEWRRLITDDLFHVVALGVVVFADGGTTWSARVGPPTDGLRGDVGVGLLGEITRASILRVLRADIAWPDTGGKPTIILSGVSLF
jgi:hypothetical protein